MQNEMLKRNIANFLQMQSPYLNEGKKRYSLKKFRTFFNDLKNVVEISKGELTCDLIE
jgi:hypothetical protein